VWSSLHRSTLALRDAPPAGGVTTGNYTTMLHHGLFAALPVLPMALLMRYLDRVAVRVGRPDSAGGPPVPGQTR